MLRNPTLNQVAWLHLEDAHGFLELLWIINQSSAWLSQATEPSVLGWGKVLSKHMSLQTRCILGPVMRKGIKERRKAVHLLGKRSEQHPGFLVFPTLRWSIRLKPFVNWNGVNWGSNYHSFTWKYFWAFSDPQNNLLGSCDTSGHILLMDTHNKSRESTDVHRPSWQLWQLNADLLSGVLGNDLGGAPRAAWGASCLFQARCATNVEP